MAATGSGVAFITHNGTMSRTRMGAPMATAAPGSRSCAGANISNRLNKAVAHGTRKHVPLFHILKRNTVRLRAWSRL